MNNNARIDYRYKQLLKPIYDNLTISVKITEEIETNQIQIQIGVRQGDTISPNLFTLALEDVFKALNRNEKDIKIDGEHLSHLRFADDIVLFSQNIMELQEMLEELQRESAKIGLTINLSKAKVMTPDNIQVYRSPNR